MAAKDSNKQLRPTIWDDLEKTAANDFCERVNLGNEASVESFFILRLLKALNYKDSQIKTKESLEALSVGRGHKREKYKPDFALKVKRSIRCVLDAKATDENIDDWIEWDRSLNQGHFRSFGEGHSEGSG